LKVLPADQHEFVQMRWKEVQEGKGKPYETVVVTKDGVRLNIFASHRDMQIRGETKYVVVIKDITEFKHNEEALRQSEDKFSKAFHATPDAIIITRVADMQLIDVNKVFERLTGYSRDEALGHTSMELDLWANPKDREKYFSTLQEQGYVREQEARFRMRSGEIMDGLVSGEAFDLGDKMHILTIIRDITQRKQAEEELRKHRDHLEKLVKDRTDILTTKTKDLNDNQLAIMATVEELESTNAKLAIAKTRAEEADRLKSVFLATMSHELRTPLNSIIGFTGIMLQGFAGPLSEEQEKQLGMVKNSARHLLALINDVLDISKIEAGQLKMDLAPFQMHEAIDNAVKIVTPLVQKQGLGLHVEVSSEVGEIISDQRRVEQILLNLLGNAIKFTEKGGLKIECHIQDNQIITNITDTGIGIKPEYMDNLFKPFVQLENGVTRRFEGTGLGLSISNKLVEMLGGRIWMESEFGKGSVFTFTLPIKMGGDMA